MMLIEDGGRIKMARTLHSTLYILLYAEGLNNHVMNTPKLDSPWRQQKLCHQWEIESLIEKYWENS